MHASQICESLLRLPWRLAGCISREEGCGGLCGFPQHVDDWLGNWWRELANLEALWSTLRPLLLHLCITTKNRREKGEEVIDKPKGPNSWKIRHFWHESLACRSLSSQNDLIFWKNWWTHGENNMDVGNTMAIPDCLILICWNKLTSCDVPSPTFSQGFVGAVSLL